MQQSILRLPEVKARCGLSRTAIYIGIRAGNFPAPIHIGNSRAVGWISTEIDSWISAQIRANRKAAA